MLRFKKSSRRISEVSDCVQISIVASQARRAGNKSEEKKFLDIRLPPTDATPLTEGLQNLRRHSILLIIHQHLAIFSINWWVFIDPMITSLSVMKNI